MDISYALAKLVDSPVLYVARHGEAGDDESYASPVNDPLDKNGIRQAHELGEFLKDKGVGSIVCSSLKRAVQTAEIVGKTLGLKPIVDDRLDSLDVGKIKDMENAKEADRIIDHHVDNPHVPIPGGESINAFRGRVWPALQDATKPGLHGGKPRLVIAHNSVQHEVGNLFNNDSDSVLTKPGGAEAVYMTPKGLVAKAIFKAEKKD